MNVFHLDLTKYETDGIEPILKKLSGQRKIKITGLNKKGKLELFNEALSKLSGGGGPAPPPPPTIEQFLEAVANGDFNVEQIRAFIDSGGDINAKDTDDKSLLYYAVRHTQEDVTTLILNNMATQDPDGLTALHLAAESGITNVIERLIGEEIRIDVQDNNDAPPPFIMPLLIAVETWLQHFLQRGQT